MLDIARLKERSIEKRDNIVHIRMTNKEVKKLKDSAKKLTRGNITHLIRYAVFDLLMGRRNDKD